LDKNLKFCLILDAGVKYVIKAELADSLASIVRLVPDEQKVELVDSPLMDVNFERLEANLNGKIVLLDKKSLTGDLLVTLKSVGARNVFSKELNVNCKEETVGDNKKPTDNEKDKKPETVNIYKTLTLNIF
jgi:hypothetical protein